MVAETLLVWRNYIDYMKIGIWAHVKQKILKRGKKKKRRSQDCNLLCLGSKGDLSTPCWLTGLFIINNFRMNQTRNSHKN